MLTFTPEALTHLQKLEQEVATEETPCLRFAVKSGGCSGLEYAMGFDYKEKDDFALKLDFGLEVIVDPKSVPWLKGCQVHFDDGLQGKGFEITNPNAEGSCGCGKSFH